MATAFRATSTGYRADLSAHERRLVSSLCADVLQLLQQRTDQLAEDPPSDGARGSSDPTDDAAADHADQSGQPDQPDQPDLTGDSPGSTVDHPTPATEHEGPGHVMDDSVFAHFSAELTGLDQEGEFNPPEDPVLRRLLPEASQDQDEAAQFRRLAEGSLRESKAADLRAARLLLERSPIRVPEDQAPVLGRALNDVRITLSARLGIEEEADAEKVHRLAVEARTKSAESFMAEVYTFVTWLQETLFSAMLEHLPEQGWDAEGPGPDDAADGGSGDGGGRGSGDGGGSDQGDAGGGRR